MTHNPKTINEIINNGRARGHSFNRIRRAVLKALNHHNHLTYEDLWSAIEFIDHGGPGCIPQSVGETWIIQNFARFRSITGNVAWFLITTAQEAAKARPWLKNFLRLVSANSKLLAALSSPYDIRDWIARYGARNNHWLDALTTIDARWDWRTEIHNMVVVSMNTQDQVFIRDLLRDWNGYFTRYGRLSQGTVWHEVQMVAMNIAHRHRNARHHRAKLEQAIGHQEFEYWLAQDAD